MSDDSKAKRKGVLDDIENALTGGYGKKEDLRALDKSLRDGYYSELVRLRHNWEKTYLKVLNSGRSALAGDCKVAIQTLDRVASSVQRADYGYAPLFDRVSSVKEQGLRKLLEYDKSLYEMLAKLKSDIQGAEAAVKSSTWQDVEAAVAALNEDISRFEELWGNRKQVANE